MSTSTQRNLPFHLVLHGDKSGLLVFAVGPHIKVLDSRKEKFIDSKDLEEKGHTDFVRSLQFNAKEDMLVSCGDDKCVKVWNCKTWSLVSERKTPKKISDAIFAKYFTSKQQNENSEEENVIIYTDKFGDAFCTPITDLNGQQTLLLGHCSTITKMILTPDQKYLITCDKDEKIRVSHYPLAFDIQSFCMGHFSVVTEICLLSDYPGLLVSGSGDGTIRLWNYLDGKLLHSIVLPIETIKRIIVGGIAYDSQNKRIGVLVEGHPSILLYSVSNDKKSLHLEQQLDLPPTSIPFHISTDSQGNFFVVGANPSFTLLKKHGSHQKYEIAASSLVDIVNKASIPQVDEAKFEQSVESVSLNLWRKNNDQTGWKENKKQKTQ